MQSISEKSMCNEAAKHCPLSFVSWNKETDIPYIIKCFKQNQLLMFFSVVHLDGMRERCCQCGTKTSKQDQLWVRNMSRSRKELVELIRKKNLIWCFSLFD